MSPVAGPPPTGAAARFENVGKAFAGNVALEDISFSVRAGSVHSIVGENGAGKSTLGKCLAGVHRPSTGRIVIDDETKDFRSPAHALGDGVAYVAQEIALVPTLTVAENVYLGAEPRRARLYARRSVQTRFHELAEATGFSGLDGRQLVSGLRQGERQRVEILRALARGARLVVMDEPTAALTAPEVDRLHEVVQMLKLRGTTVVFVSHFLQEVLALSDVVTVLRDGRHVRTEENAGLTEADLVSRMIGRELPDFFPPRTVPPRDAPLVLSVSGLARPPVVNDVNLEVRAGEIVGLVGLVGSGRSEVAHAVYAADRGGPGEIAVSGRVTRFRSPREAIDGGVALLPESRRDQALVLNRPIRENVVLNDLGRIASLGVVRRRRLRAAAEQAVGTLRVKAAGIDQEVGQLSGGNQQKVALAKCMFTTPRLLIVDEPTRGVDVGGKKAIYDHIAELAADGVAVLLISSETEEVIGLAHRVYVMRNGRTVAQLEGDLVTEEAILAAALVDEHAPTAQEIR